MRQLDLVGRLGRSGDPWKNKESYRPSKVSEEHLDPREDQGHRLASLT